MKIVVAGPCSVKGLCEGLPPECDEDHPSELVRSLVDRYLAAGHQVEVVKFNLFVTSPARFVKGNAAVNLIPRRRQGILLTPGFWRPERRKAAAAIKKASPDVVHAHWTYEYAVATLQSKFPSVITAHDVPPRLRPLMRPIYYWWPRLSVGYFISLAAPRMTAQSPHTLECWKKEVFRRKPIELVLNPVAPEVFELFRSHAPSKDPVFAASCVGFFPHKNVSNLIEAFAKVKAQIPLARLVLYGNDHGPGQSANSWASERGLEKGVEFRGNTDRMTMLRELAQMCTVFVHPSREESFGMAVAEAMALAIPVVGGKDAGAVPWLLDSGQAGVLCDVESSSDIARAMLDAVDRQDLGLIGRNRVLELCNLEQVANDYLAILEDQAEKGRSSKEVNV